MNAPSDRHALKRRRRPRRSHVLLAGAGVTGMLVLAALAWSAAGLGASPARLALRSGGGPPVGPTAGTWRVALGSVVGFRIRETILLGSNDVVGRTGDVTGELRVTGRSLDASGVAVALHTLTISGQTRSALLDSLHVASHPMASFTLARPVTLPAAFGKGDVATGLGAGQLTLNGLARPVEVTLSARRVGADLEVAGSFPVILAHWEVKAPEGFGPLGSLSSHATAEFRLVLSRQEG